MSRDPGKKWPWIVVISILGVVGLSYWTVQLALKNPVELSDIDMLDHQHFDRDINSIITAKIAFDKKYDITYVTEVFKEDHAEVKFKVMTKAGQPVNDANITLRITRPGTHEFDRDIALKDVSDGVYSFENVTLPKPGRWDILSRVQVGDDLRYINLKADTRYPNVFEY